MGRLAIPAGFLFKYFMRIAKFLESSGQSGTTGTVFRAETDLNREVAVKFFNDPIVQIRDEIKKHALALTKVKHKNVVEIFDIEDVARPDKENAQPEPALIMEYVPGQKFSDWLNKPSITRSEALGVINGLLDGLDAIHNAKMVEENGDIRNIGWAVKWGGQ